jgi:AcrR family transcriptional regulator
MKDAQVQLIERKNAETNNQGEESSKTSGVREQAKRRILNAASTLFASGGIAALSVRAIAEQAEVSTIGIYSHFKGKQGILDALYIEGYDMVYHTMDFDKQGLSPKEILLQGIAGYLQIAQDYEGHYRLIFGENDNQYKPSDEAKASALRAYKRLVQHTSIILPENAEWIQRQQTALELWAFVHGYVSLKHHVTGPLISSQQWYGMANDGISTHIDALLKKYQKD